MSLDYRQAAVIVFDPVNVNLRTTQYALHQIGFREIICMTSIAEVRRRLTEQTPQLLVCETASVEDEVAKLVREIRTSELGDNPFLAVLLTSWMRDGAVLKQAISSGADDVVIRPFSTAFIEDRLRTLVRARKPFIVTSDYIGPDRRRDTERGPGALTPINAPNTLRTVVEGEGEDLEAVQAWIAEARSDVESERLRRLAMRIVVGVEAAMREMQAGRTPQIDPGDIARSARELRLRFSRMRMREAASIAQALVEVCSQLVGVSGLSSGNLSLAKELATGAYAAYAGGDGIERSREEIDHTVEALRKRMAAGAQDAGAAPVLGLKRAAS
ncbi:MAG: response regulator receiver protein [Pseudomonadota bacterium]